MIKRSRKHEEVHSESWKIAIADFFTALMTFFLAMWLSSQSDEIRASTADYFRDPLAQQAKSRNEIVMAGNARQRILFQEVQAALKNAIARHPDFFNIEQYIDIRVTEEGLVIELLDSEESLFFELGRDELKKEARELLIIIAQTLSKLPNPIVIEGHTDAAPFKSDQLYSNWELSVARANSARRVMESILRNGQIVEVRGYADRKLRDPSRPRHFSNRRVSIVARYVSDKNVVLPHDLNVQGIATEHPGQDHDVPQANSAPASKTPSTIL